MATISRNEDVVTIATGERIDTSNAVEFENLGDTPKRYIMRTLINYGAIAYDKETKLFLRFVPIGYDIYGLPEEYQLYGYNGYTITRKPDEVVILNGF